MDCPEEWHPRLSSGLHMYVYITHAPGYTCTYIHTCTWIHIYVHSHMHSDTHVCTFTHALVYTYMYIYTCTWIPWIHPAPPTHSYMYKEYIVKFLNIFGFSVFFLLVSDFILLWSENRVCCRYDGGAVVWIPRDRKDSLCIANIFKFIKTYFVVYHLICLEECLSWEMCRLLLYREALFGLWSIVMFTSFSNQFSSWYAISFVTESRTRRLGM